VQQNLSLRSQIVNPLVVIFIVLASTAALVREAGCMHLQQQALMHSSTSRSRGNLLLALQQQCHAQLHK
jgi:hypothetical protein